MKKVVLSLFLIVSFTAYTLYTRIIGTDVPLTLTPETNKPVTPLVLPTYTPKTPTPTGVASSPTPSQNTGKYKNGTYTGPSIDAYYGNVQVKVVITGGKITDVQFLDHPQSRQTSIRINERAIPYLISEAISAQSADVNAVSGASFTSAAYKESLSSALNEATI